MRNARAPRIDARTCRRQQPTVCTKEILAKSKRTTPRRPVSASSDPIDVATSASHNTLALLPSVNWQELCVTMHRVVSPCVLKFCRVASIAQVDTRLLRHLRPAPHQRAPPASDPAHSRRRCSRRHPGPSLRRHLIPPSPPQYLPPFRRSKSARRPSADRRRAGRAKAGQEPTSQRGSACTRPF